jgi:hypothetical protein
MKESSIISLRGKKKRISKYLKDIQKRIRQARYCDVRIKSILLDVNKRRKHRVFKVVISLKRPGIQMIDFS